MSSILTARPDIKGHQAESTLMPSGFVERTYNIRWKVVADGTISPVQVLLYPGLPQEGETLDLSTQHYNNFDTTVYCARRRVTIQETKIAFVDCEYLPFPSLEKTRESWNDEKIELTVWRDRDGKAVVNSAKQWFNPPITVPFPTAVGSIEKYYSPFDFSFLTPYLYGVNDSYWRSYAPGTALLGGANAEKLDFFGVTFWRVTYKIAINEVLGWKKAVLDMGRYQKGTDGGYEPILPGGTEVATEPMLLNGSGKPKTADAPPTFLEFNFNQDVDLYSLGIF